MSNYSNKAKNLLRLGLSCSPEYVYCLQLTIQNKINSFHRFVITINLAMSDPTTWNSVAMRNI